MAKQAVHVVTTMLGRVKRKSVFVGIFAWSLKYSLRLNPINGKKRQELSTNWVD
jgi:hypothetical protein